VLLAVALTLAAPAAPARAATASAPCPLPLDQLPRGPGATSSGVGMCVDRGDGATYVEGDPITLCVTVSVPTIMIYPPPPPPAVRVTDSTDGGRARTVLADAFNGDSRCISGTVEAPFGRDVFRAQVLGANDVPIAEHAVQVITQPR
jgi:hypothetical protein